MDQVVSILLSDVDSPYINQSMDDSGYSDDMTEVSSRTNELLSSSSVNNPESQYIRPRVAVSREPSYPYPLQVGPYSSDMHSMGAIPYHRVYGNAQPRPYYIVDPSWNPRPMMYASPRYYSEPETFRPVQPSKTPYRYAEPKPSFGTPQRNRVTYSQPVHHSSPPSEPPQMIVKGMPQYNIVKQQVEEAVALKRSNIAAAKAVLDRLCEEYPHCHIVWMELSRLEMEQGNIIQCRKIVLRGLEMLPNNETLLEKRVKVEERLRNVDGVIACAKEFLEMNSTRCVKSIVEAAIVVAKLGCGYKASTLFNSLLDHNLFTQGGVTLDYIRFVFKTEDYQKGLRMLKETLAKLTKHGPMWFFTFSVLEQNHTIYWLRGDIRNRPNNRDLAFHLQQALTCLSEDLKWKVYYIAAQAQLRSFTHMRLWTRLKKRYLKSYCETHPEVIHSCFGSLHRCVKRCPDDYKWKVWLLAGRVQALAGKRYSAIRVGESWEYECSV